MENFKKVSKRDFLKLSMIGLGYLFLPVRTKGNKIFKNMKPQNIKPQHMREAKYYKNTDRGILCELCPNYCYLKEKKLSSCKTRIAKDDKLYTIAYGNPCSVHTDPIEKKPLYHFLPSSKSFSIATAGCNLSCLNCQNYTISQVSPADTRNYDLPPKELIKKVKEAGAKSIAYTYSEPIAYYEYTYDSAKLAKEEGIKNVFISAGYINEKPLKDIAKYLDAANIDLKSFNDDTYKKLNAGSLKPVLDTLVTLKDAGVWIEITNLIVPGWSDKEEEIKEMCKWLADNGFEDYPLHFSRFHPMYKLQDVPPTPLKTLNNAKKIAENAGLKYVFIGNVPGTDAANTYCHKCGKLLINRKGFYVKGTNIENGKCKYCGEEIPGVWV